MIKAIWAETFEKLEGFTIELEKAKSTVALVEFKPLWRIMKSIQLRHVPDLAEAQMRKLDKLVQRMEIREVEPSSFTEAEAVGLLQRFCTTCSINPDLMEGS